MRFNGMHKHILYLLRNRCTYATCIHLYFATFALRTPSGIKDEPGKPMNLSIKGGLVIINP
jgi:hypothetical protein